MPSWWSNARKGTCVSATGRRADVARERVAPGTLPRMCGPTAIDRRRDRSRGVDVLMVDQASRRDQVDVVVDRPRLVAMSPTVGRPKCNNPPASSTRPTTMVTVRAVHPRASSSTGTGPTPRPSVSTRVRGDTAEHRAAGATPSAVGSALSTTSATGGHRVPPATAAAQTEDLAPGELPVAVGFALVVDEEPDRLATGDREYGTSRYPAMVIASKSCPLTMSCASPASAATRPACDPE